MAEPSPALVKRAQAGDPEALSALVQSQQTYVYSIAMSLMHNPADAADMTQEAFIRLLRSLGTYRAETKFTTWLYRLVTDICLDGLRRRGRPSSRSTSRQARAAVRIPRRQASGWPTTIAGRSPSKRSRSANRPPKCVPHSTNCRQPQRLALTLHYFEDMRYEDIAEAMHLPLNTVKSHIRRGKERLALALSNPAEEESWTA